MKLIDRLNHITKEIPSIQETSMTSLQEFKEQKNKEKEGTLKPKRGRPAGRKNISKKKEKRKYERKAPLKADMIEQLKGIEEELREKNPKGTPNPPSYDLPVPSKLLASDGRKVHPHSFKPGNSFGLGKIKGTRNRSVLALETVCYDNANELLLKMVTLGKEGDMTAARFVLERILPLAKGKRVKLDLPELKDMASIDQSMNVIVENMAEGEITLEEAETATRVIESKIKSFIQLSMEERMLKIEEILMQHGLIVK